MNVTEESLEFCRGKADEYRRDAVGHEAMAEKCKPAARGAHRSHAVQKRKSADRMEANLAAQLGWLAENNIELWLALKDEFK
jgi:hypothetical protein